MVINTDNINGYAYARVSGSITGADVDMYNSFIDERLSDGSRIFIINLKDVRDIDAQGMQMLLSSRNKINEVAGRFILCGVDNIALTLYRARRYYLFEIFDTEADACEEVGAPLPKFVAC